MYFSYREILETAICNGGDDGDDDDDDNNDVDCSDGDGGGGDCHYLCN